MTIGPESEKLPFETEARRVMGWGKLVEGGEEKGRTFNAPAHTSAYTLYPGAPVSTRAGGGS